jgi:hypothetical protein
MTNKIPFNIQLFAEGDEDAGQDVKDKTVIQDEPKQTEPEVKKPEEKQEAKFTEKDLSSYADKRVTDAIKKKEAEYQKQIEEIKRELEMSKLSEKERIEAEKKHREEELQKREQEISERQLRIDTLEYFNEEKIPNGFLEIIDPIKDLDKRKEAVGVIQEMIEEQVTARVKEMEKGSFTGSRGTGEPMPKDPKEALRQTFKK